MRGIEKILVGSVLKKGILIPFFLKRVICWFSEFFSGFHKYLNVHLLLRNTTTAIHHVSSSLLNQNQLKVTVNFLTGHKVQKSLRVKLEVSSPMFKLMLYSQLDNMLRGQLLYSSGRSVDPVLQFPKLHSSSINLKHFSTLHWLPSLP